LNDLTVHVVIPAKKLRLFPDTVLSYPLNIIPQYRLSYISI
jgi:hypothetical protein